jgi:hypothetical protein
MNSKESPEVWTPPELIVLVRSHPEEAVLGACKNGGHAVWGANYDFERCYLNGGYCAVYCDAQGAS